MANSLHTWLASGSISHSEGCQPSQTAAQGSMQWLTVLQPRKQATFFHLLKKACKKSGKDCESTMSISAAQIGLLC